MCNGTSSNRHGQTYLLCDLSRLLNDMIWSDMLSSSPSISSFLLISFVISISLSMMSPRSDWSKQVNQYIVLTWQTSTCNWWYVYVTNACRIFTEMPKFEVNIKWNGYKWQMMPTHYCNWCNYVILGVRTHLIAFVQSI